MDRQTDRQTDRMAGKRALTRYGVPEVLFEPSKQAIQRGVNSSSVPETVGGDTDILYPWLNTRKIPQEELPRELLGCTHKVGDPLWSLPFLHLQNFFQFCLYSVHRSVVLVIENLSRKWSHWLNMPCNDLVQIFKFLSCRESSLSYNGFSLRVDLHY